MGAFLLRIAKDDVNRELKARAALASTFVAGLELAKQEVLQLEQRGIFLKITFSCHTACFTL
jgi:chromatin segregation and condensation protein Rec8/ScpA/Scc1 (kleisin family)